MEYEIIKIDKTKDSNLTSEESFGRCRSLESALKYVRRLGYRRLSNETEFSNPDIPGEFPPVLKIREAPLVYLDDQ